MIEPALSNPLLRLVFSLSDDDTLNELQDSQFVKIVHRVQVSRLTQLFKDVFSTEPSERHHLIKEELDFYWDENSCLFNKIKKIQLIPQYWLDRPGDINAIEELLFLIPKEEPKTIEFFLEKIFKELFAKNFYNHDFEEIQYITDPNHVSQLAITANKIINKNFKLRFYRELIKYLAPEFFTEDMLIFLKFNENPEIACIYVRNILERIWQLIKSGKKIDKHIGLLNKYSQKLNKFADIINSFMRKVYPDPKDKVIEFPNTIQQIQARKKMDLFCVQHLIPRVRSSFYKVSCLMSIEKSYFWKPDQMCDLSLDKIKKVDQLTLSVVGLHRRVTLDENAYKEIELFIERCYDFLIKIFNIKEHIKNENYDAALTLIYQNTNNICIYNKLLVTFINEFFFHYPNVRLKVVSIQKIFDATQLNKMCKKYKKEIDYLTISKLFGNPFDETGKELRQEYRERVNAIKGNEKIKKRLLQIGKLMPIEEKKET